MISSTAKKRLALGLTVATLGASMLAGSANADPAQYGALAGFGSDTSQDVLNALSGKSNGLLYTPIQSSAATGGKQIISFDAIAPAGAADNCVTPKIGAPTFTRPNGSTQGRRALSRAQDGAGYGSAECGIADVSGVVDFARSSSGPSGTSGALTYIPFARDGISFAVYRPAGSPVTTMTRAELDALFTTGPQVIGGVRMVPCGIQDGSGTYAFWNTAAGVSAGEEATATTLCRSVNAGVLGNGRLQENNAVQLKEAGDLVAALPGEANTQVVVGFSAGAFIAKSNGVATPTPPAEVKIGAVSNNGSGVNLGSPVVGTAPNLTPSASYFADSVFGRRIYNVFPSSVINGFGNADLKDLFVGSTSKICQATTTINTFGFLVAPDCGVTTITGDLVTGQL